MAIYMWREEPIYPTESIVIKMMADSSGKLYVPTAGLSTTGQTNCTYDWQVSVDYGTATQYSGTGRDGGAITLSGYTSNQEYTIKITPTTEKYQWARAFGWANVASGSLLIEVLYDGSYMGYGVSATDTGNYFRANQYSNCTSLITAPDEVLPDGVTSIGNSFRRDQYAGCTSLTTASVEVLPNSVTSIGVAFRMYQYSGCTSLTTAPVEVLPDGVTSIGNSFRSSQYNGCTSLTTISGWKDLNIGDENHRIRQFYNCTSNKTVTVVGDVGYASYDSETLQNSYVTQVRVPSAYLSNFVNSTKYPRRGITDSKFVAI